MVKYDQSVIYKLCCKDPEIKEIYIGSTTNFTRRKNAHKCDCNNENGKSYNLYVYRFIRANSGFENWDMVPVEQYNATDKHDLHARERYWIETMKAGLNKQVPTRTGAEYREQNKDRINKNKKEWYEETKETRKIYRDNNKDHKKQYDVIYREQNKNKLGEKFNCECGGVYIKRHKSTHMKTQKHIRYLGEIKD